MSWSNEALLPEARILPNAGFVKAGFANEPVLLL